MMFKCLGVLIPALLATTLSIASAQDRQPISNKTCDELLAFYDKLPFTDILPLEAGPIMIEGKERALTIGFSQTGFNHPWRISMLEAIQAEACRHPNVSLVVLDGNVDVAKQNNDVRDLLARGVDGVVMSPVESAGLVPAARAVMDAGLPLVLLDRDVTSEKTLFIGQSNVTMAEKVAERMAADLGGKGNIVAITGLQGSSPAVDRDKGMQNVLAKFPDIKVLVKGDGQWIREPAVKLMKTGLRPTRTSTRSSRMPRNLPGEPSSPSRAPIAVLRVSATTPSTAPMPVSNRSRPEHSGRTAITRPSSATSACAR